ncbi:hypothetical protein [Williamsia sp. CHRR-6]|uniref:hypothetical protein n=1 Tax=Williamsia sp. CHRR-6 TaxID=2835871 RepID=UPI001BD9E1C8|nr:hypothetical protein [Williamsia sp. CHRR-6]MBT0566260.1 hypothetical protein [Williamsia sp. CHRR-6]
MSAYDDDDDEYDWRGPSPASQAVEEPQPIINPNYLGLVEMELDELGLPVRVKAERSLLSSIDIHNLSAVFLACYREALWKMEAPVIESGDWKNLAAFRSGEPTRALEGYSPTRAEDGYPVVVVKARNSLIRSIQFDLHWAARSESWVIAEEFRDACHHISQQLTPFTN